MEIKMIGIVGAGQMGNGIAQVAAHAGFQVVMSDIADSFVQKGLATISKNLGRMVEKGKIPSPQKDEILGRIRGTIQVQDMKEADFVVEAATESEPLKLTILRLGPRLPTRGDPFNQYLLHLDHKDLLRPNGPLRSSDTYKPGTCHAARRDYPRGEDFQETFDAVKALAERW
jgi:hypothetical protein